MNKIRLIAVLVVLLSALTAAPSNFQSEHRERANITQRFNVFKGGGFQLSRIVFQIGEFTYFRMHSVLFVEHPQGLRLGGRHVLQYALEERATVPELLGVLKENAL